METKKVIFETLPKESLVKRVYRKVFRKPRPYEYVVMSLNGYRKIIQRGIVVELDHNFLFIADTAPEHFKYNYKIIPNRKELVEEANTILNAAVREFSDGLPLPEGGTEVFKK